MHHATTAPFQDDSAEGALSLLTICLLLLLSVTAATAVAVWPKAGQPLGVVFAPGVSLDIAMQRVSDAGGAIIDFGSAQNVVIALATSDDFITQLFSNGALLVLDGRLTSALCLPPND